MWVVDFYPQYTGNLLTLFFPCRNSKIVFDFYKIFFLCNVHSNQLLNAHDKSSNLKQNSKFSLHYIVCIHFSTIKSNKKKYKQKKTSFIHLKKKHSLLRRKNQYFKQIRLLFTTECIPKISSDNYSKQVTRWTSETKHNVFC